MGNIERRYDIDWIRVLAFYLLILFHTGMFFVPWEWHVKNSITSEAFEPIMSFLHQWRLPLLFVISGVGVSFALKFRSPLKFIKERNIRLFIPLIFGMFVIVPPQIYYERLVNGIQYSSYLEFYKTVFDLTPYPEGSFSWHHLWFVIYILVYAQICLPIFLYLRSKSGQKFINKCSVFFKKPGSLLLLAIPLGIVFDLLVLQWSVTHNLIEDWYNFTYSILFFIYGYFISSNKNLWEIIVDQRKIFLITTISLTLFLFLFSWFPVIDLFPENSNMIYLYGFIKSTNILAIIFSIFGYGKLYLNKPSKILTYANESVYPFYILHQTITLTVGYYIKDWDLGIILKFGFLAIATFVGCFVIYEVLIKHFNITRILFGLKSKKKIQQISKEILVEKIS